MTLNFTEFTWCLLFVAVNLLTLTWKHEINRSLLFYDEAAGLQDLYSPSIRPCSTLLMRFCKEILQLYLKDDQKRRANCILRQGSHENLEGHEMTTQSQIPWQ